MKYVIAYNKLTITRRLRFMVYLTFLSEILSLLLLPWTNRMLHITNKIISLHILLWNLLARQNLPNYMVLNINYYNSFSSPIYIQVIFQRCAIKKVNQPCSKKITLQILTVVTIKRTQFDARRGTNNQQRTTNNEKKLFL